MNRIPSPSEPCPASEKTILIVDDEQIIVKSAAALLKRNGYQTLLAYDGMAACVCFREHHTRIDLVLLDLEIPVITGAACLRKFKTINPEVRIIAHTGHPEPPATIIDADAFLAKPYSMKELLQTVERLLSS